MWRVVAGGQGAVPSAGIACSRALCWKGLNLLGEPAEGQQNLGYRVK